jgi:hypothetical protein
MFRSFLAALLLGACAAVPAADFDPVQFRDRIEGEPTRVFVLGSAHLSSAPAGFEPRMLEPLLEKLAGFRPDLIAIESLSGETLHTLKSYALVYPDLADTFGGTILSAATAAQAETGLSMPEAEARKRQLLRSLPFDPQAAQRRSLAATMLAAGDLYSALVQWKRLPPAERVARDGITAELHALLGRALSWRNESASIGAELAARLGHERVHPVDDHTAGDASLAVMDRLAVVHPEIQREIRKHPYTAGAPERARLMAAPDGILASYRAMNSADAGRLDAEAQWLPFLSHKSPDLIGRQRLAEWEARNLRMAAHIREAFAHHPGQRVLVVVGSSHKPYLEAYLSLMHDVVLVPADEVLN